MGIKNFEIVRIDGTAIDGSLAIYCCINGIVACRLRTKLIFERFVHPRIANIVLNAVARVCVRCKGTAHTASILAGCLPGCTCILPSCIERTCRDSIPGENGTDYRCRRRIRNPGDTARRIRRCAIIGLRHIAHLNAELARRDHTRICLCAEIRRHRLICT